MDKMDLNNTRLHTNYDRKYVVYKIVRRKTGEYYIGKTKMARWWERTYNSPIGRALAEHGRDQFDWYKIKEFDDIKKALKFEERMIDVSDPLCYNVLASGNMGMTGHKHSKKSIKKMKTSFKHRPPQSEESKARKRAAMTGKPRYYPDGTPIRVPRPPCQNCGKEVAGHHLKSCSYECRTANARKKNG